MKGTFWAAAGAAWLLAATAAAQPEAPPTDGAPGMETPAAEGGDILTYAPEFFASSNPQTALDMVNRIPGFSIDDGENVRGFAGSEGNVLINGAPPASKSDSGSDVLSRTPASRVVRIDLIRGGAPGIDMQGRSVVANVILSGEASRELTVEARTAMFEGGPTLPGGSVRYTASDGDRSWGLRVGRGLSWNDSTGFGDLTRTDAAGTVILLEDLTTGFDGGGWFGGGDWSGPVGPGKAEFTASANDFYFEQFSLFVSDAGARRFDSRNDNRSVDAGLRYEVPVSETVTLTGRLIQELGEDMGWSSSLVGGEEQIFTYDNNSGESIGRLEARWQRTPRLTFEGSVEGAYNFLDTAQSFAIDGENVPLPGASVKVEELRGEASAKAIWQASDTLTAEAGVRLEQSRITQSGDTDSEKSLFYPKPRLAVTWSPRENDQFRFRFERELGQLDFGDFAASTSLTNDEVFGGNADLEPEQRWIFEGVYERRFWGDGALTLTYRHDEIIDVIDTLPLPDGLSAVGNIGDGTLDRIRIDLRIPTDRFGIPNGRLTLELPWELTSVTDPTTGEQRSISGVREFRPTVDFEQDIPSLDLTWGVFWLPYYKDPNFQPDQQTWFSVHNFVEAFAEYTISQGFTARVSVTVWDDFRVGRDVYEDRDTRQIAYRERRQTDPRNFVQLRLRKTF